MLENILKRSGNLKGVVTNAITFIVSAFIIAIASQISVPLPGGVPMTLQTFSVALVGFCLSKNKGVKAILTYLGLGLIGMPVFAGAKSGAATLFGLTGGFLIGFNLLVLFCGMAKQAKNIPTKILLSIIGLMLCHILGILQYSFLTNTNIIQAFMLVSLPFLLKDALSVILAFMISEKFKIKKSEQ